MDKYSTKTWGYHVISAQAFTFYHVLLPKIPIKTICRNVAGVEEISVNHDQSITVISNTVVATLRTLIDYFQKLENNSLETEPSYFVLSNSSWYKLSQWKETYLSIVALMLCKKYDYLEWGILHSNANTFFVENFTITIYENYATIIHPVTVKNFDERTDIEESIADIMTKIGKYIRNKNANAVGEALLKFGEVSIGISHETIKKLIDHKVKDLYTPSYVKGQLFLSPSSNNNIV